MLIFQHFLICYFICPPELRGEKKKSIKHHFTSFLLILGGRLIDLGFMMSVLSAPFPLFLFLLCVPPPPPLPLLPQISSTWNLILDVCPEARRKWEARGSFPSPQSLAEILMPRTRLTPQTSGCRPRIFSLLPNLVSEVKWFLF